MWRGKIAFLSVAAPFAVLMAQVCVAAPPPGAPSGGNAGFDGEVPASCRVIGSMDERYYPYLQGERVPGSGHVDKLEREEYLDFDCNTDSVNVTVSVIATPPGNVEEDETVHTVTKVEAIAQGRGVQNLLGGPRITATRTEVDLLGTLTNAQTDDEGNIAINVGSSYTPPDGVEELKAGGGRYYKYIAVFTITLTAN